MIISNIPDEVYKAALELRGVYPDSSRFKEMNWSFKKEYQLLEDQSGFPEGELAQSIANYLLKKGEFEER